MFKPLIRASSEYNIIHKKLHKVLGPASNWDCIDCDEQAKEWSWTHDADPNLIGSYSARCVRCHRRYDRPTTGIQNGNAILSEQDVKDIRAKFKGGVLQRQMAVEYGMSVRQIGKIVRRENWGHVK